MSQRRVRRALAACRARSGVDGTALIHDPFDFRWDSRGYPNPAVALAKIRQAGFKVCVRGAVDIDHSPLFHDLAARKYLMTDAAPAA